MYAGSRLPSVPIAVTVRLTDDSDRVVYRTSEPFGRDRFDAARLARHLFDVPIDRLTPGRFLLTVAEAADSADGVGPLKAQNAELKT